MDALLTIHSDGFQQSPFCNQEVGYALARHVPIISLMDGEPPSGFLSETQGIAIRLGEEGQTVTKVLNLFEQRSPDRYLAALARTLQQAGSYGHADMITKEIVMRSALTDETLADIRAAIRFNDQVYGSGNADRLIEWASQHGRTIELDEQAE